jgi:hypothetical protein
MLPWDSDSDSDGKNFFPFNGIEINVSLTCSQEHTHTVGQCAELICSIRISCILFIWNPFQYGPSVLRCPVAFHSDSVGYLFHISHMAASSGCEWRRQPWGMEGTYKHAKYSHGQSARFSYLVWKLDTGLVTISVWSYSVTVCYTRPRTWVDFSEQTVRTVPINMAS